MTETEKVEKVDPKTRVFRAKSRRVIRIKRNLHDQVAGLPKTYAEVPQLGEP